MRINNNIMAMNTHRQYTINTNSVAKSTEKLSSGYRINRAGDDAAGLAISEKMRAQIRGLTMASKNSNDAISLVQTAEGALQETHNILQRMRELAVQSASDTNETSIDRDALNKEFQALIAEIDDTAAKTKFNDMGLIDGTYSQNITHASTAATAYSNVWASTGTAAGNYTITAKTETVSAAVTGVESTDGGSFAAGTATSVGGTGTLTATFVKATGAATMDSSLQGTWSFTVENGFVCATNGTTNEVRKLALDASPMAAVNGKQDYDFGNLGILTITNSHATEVGSLEGLTGCNVAIGSATTAKAAEYKDYITINGKETVELQDGASTVVFGKSGVTLNLTSTHTKGTTPGAITGYSGTVAVTKESRNPFVVQTGANQYDELAISIDKMDAYTLGVKTANISNRLDASAAITQVNSAINTVSTQRASLGALQNRLSHKIANLDTSAENLQAAESRIRDLDMAKEMTQFTRNNILVQASTAMLAQANAAPQGVLQLLQ